MKKAGSAAVAAIAAVSLAGCGTICNFAHGDPDIYGGVQKDVAFIQTPGTVGGSKVGCQGGVYAAALVFADLGLSLVADTLTLPLAISMRHNERGSDERVSADGVKTAKSASLANQPIPSDRSEEQSPTR